jgi:pimeloyl-ACP methyl ester carboxylesterase
MAGAPGRRILSSSTIDREDSTVETAANGTSLYVEQVGEGPPLVFVHGMCGDARVWADQVDRLGDRYRCTTYDRRGHTRSPRTDVVESVELHADDLAALITTLELAPAVVVGSSGGARIALDLIRRYPELVRGAVLSEPPIGALAPEAFAALLSEVGPVVRQAAEADGPAAAVDAFFSAVCPGLWSRIDESDQDRYRDNAPMLFADLGMPSYEITPDDLAGILVPTLAVAGTRSHPALREAAHTVARWLPDARYLELDCGHVTYAERPAEFARAVAAFAGELAHVAAPG